MERKHEEEVKITHLGEKQLPVKCQICSKSMTMKQIILFIALLASTTLGAQTYYWVGGTGDWSDLSHWATTSGGSTFHTQLPGESNDVRFDENSFTAVQQVVTLDQAYQECRTLDATGVLNNPMIAFKYRFSKAISFICELTKVFSLELITNNELSPISNKRSSAFNSVL